MKSKNLKIGICQQKREKIVVKNVFSSKEPAPNRVDGSASS
ncbi:hypothetical protein RCH33_2154 [Flavobacterium daejeonense]|nr:hypothetical protein RCH33_2154 [Flavobacterium daejeonense]